MGGSSRQVGNRERNGCMMTRREYIKQVSRHLQCSGARKREIEKQLDSHIGIGLDEGRPLEEILAEMGEPVAIAEEFNDSFEEKERKRAGSRKWMLILIPAVLLFLAAGAGLVYWALPKQRDINTSRVFDLETVEARAEEVILLFGRREYGTLENYLTQEVKKAFEDMPMESVRQMIGDDWGEFYSMGNMYLAEVSQMGKSYAVVQVNVSYEKVSVTYTMTFNEAMEVYGFYIK